MTQPTVRRGTPNRPRPQAALLLSALLPVLLAPGLTGCGKPAGESERSAALAVPPVSAARQDQVATVHPILREASLSVRPQPEAIAAAGPDTRKAPAAASRGTNAAFRTTQKPQSTRPGNFDGKAVPGERRIYALEYSSMGASDFQALFAGQKGASSGGGEAPANMSHRVQTALRGKLVATVLEEKRDRVLIAYSVEQPELRFQADGQEAPEAETIRHDLGRPVFATLTRRGSLLSVRLDPAAGRLSQGFARTLLALTQVVLPAKATSSVWLAREEDPNGAYVARYQWAPGMRRTPSGTAVRTFQKSIVRYLQPHRETRPDEFTVPTEIRTTGGLTGVVDASSGQVASMSGSQEQVVLMSSRRVARTTTTLRLRLLGREVMHESDLAQLRTASADRDKGAAAVPLFVPESRDATEAAIQRNELGEDTLESLIAALAPIEADPKASDTTLYLKFKALAYLHPEACERLGELLTAAAPRSRTMPVLIGALGSVGHPAAQAALVRAIKAHRDDWAVLSMLIPTLGGVPEPTPAAEATLRDLARHSRRQEIATTAELSLGIMARNLARTAPARTARIVEETLAALRSARSPEAVRQHLLVLGNAGAPRSLPAIAHCLKSRLSVVRAAAADALRGIDAGPAEQLLTRALAADPDAGVRLEAAVALGARAMSRTAFAVQKRALLVDRGANVRLAVLTNLWRARGSFPEVQALVRQAAAGDADKEVRKAAAGLAKLAVSSTTP